MVSFAFRKKAGPWLRDHLDESVNYNILVLVALVLLVILALVFTAFALPMIALLAFVLGLLLYPVKVILEIVAIVKGGREIGRATV